MKEKQDKTFKMIIIGPIGVGKSSLLNKFIRGEFKEGYNTTLGVQFFSKTVQIDGETHIKLQIWDTAGQESFRSIVKTFYRSSAAVFLVYNITKYSIDRYSHQSFEQL